MKLIAHIFECSLREAETAMKRFFPEAEVEVPANVKLLLRQWVVKGRVVGSFDNGELQVFSQ